MQERDKIAGAVENYRKIERELEDSLGLIELGEAEGDEAVVLEAENTVKALAASASQMEIECMLSGEADGNNCFLEIHPGAGGTESHDWAQMLFRMYLRWANDRGFRTEILEEQSGEEAGLKSATVRISGHNAYGWLKTESGVHRLVRISPFDSNARRHTSFASIWIYPEVDDDIAIEINEKDVRVDTYRASGAGGQHVNKTDSAVRLTHIPTGIVVQCQNDRSQHKNRAEAWKMLRAKMYEQELKKREEAASAANAAKTDNAWGHQIRSYVLHPYQMVKDHRTGYETSNTGAVLDGKIDDFINASLAARVKGDNNS